MPIRIDLEADGYRLSDTFTWNLNGKVGEHAFWVINFGGYTFLFICSFSRFFSLIETVITPGMFAEMLCDDLDLPPPLFATDIAKAIQEQTEDYYLHAPSMMDASVIHPQQQEPSSEKISSGPEFRTVIKVWMVIVLIRRVRYSKLTERIIA